MSDRTPVHRRFFAEVKRRGVFKVAAVYGAVAFAVLQGADIVFPSLGLPEKTLTIVVMVALAGFPVVIALAWAYELTGQGVRLEDPPTRDELERIAAEPREKRWLAGLVALVAVLLMAGTGWLILTRGSASSPQPGASPVTRVVVLPFTVRGNEEYGYLGEGLVDVLSKKLDVAGELRGVDPRAVLALVNREGGGVPDPEEARGIAGQLRADYFVLGVLQEIGNVLQLDASLYDTDGGLEAVAEATAEGNPESVLDLVDEVASQLLLSTGAGSGGPVARIAAVTTDSLSALKDYLHGERALRAGQYIDAAGAFERAVAIDSAFALAWYRLSVAYEWLTRDDLVSDAAEQAFRHSGRLSERDRKLLEATVAARQGDHDRAEQQYRGIVGVYPDDVEAWFQLGEVLFHYGPAQGRPLSQSREAFERVLSYEPDHVNSIIHLARIPAVAGDVEEVDSLVGLFLSLNPEADRAAEMQALRAFAGNDSIAQERAVRNLRRVSDPALLITVSYVPVMTESFHAGDALTAILIEESRAPEMRALGHVLRAYLDAARGRLADAADELAAAERLEAHRAIEFGTFLALLPFFAVEDDTIRARRREIEALDPDTLAPSAHPSGYIRAHDGVHRHVRAFLVGLLGARLGDHASAERYADQLRELQNPESSPTLGEDLALGLLAYSAWLRGETDAALSLLNRARMQSFYQNGFKSPFYLGSLQRYLRALILQDDGRFEAAIRWYSSFHHVSMYDLVFLAPSHLRRAEIYERLGDAEAARRHYARFIELWAECDPQLRPQVDRARQRLAELAGEPGPG